MDPEDIDNQMAVIIGLTQRAMKGDAKAAKAIFELLGENAKEETDGGVTIVDDIT